MDLLKSINCFVFNFKCIIIIELEKFDTIYTPSVLTNNQVSVLLQTMQNI